MFTQILVAIGLVVALLFHTAGIYFAIQSVMISRTPQAAIGWGFALVLPYVPSLHFSFLANAISGYALCKDQHEGGCSARQAQRALTPFRRHSC
jgi:hypothetical protein